MNIKSAFAYTGLFIISYIPQLISKIEPIKSELKNAKPILIAKFTIASLLLPIFIFLIILSIYTFLMSYKNGIAVVKFIVTFFVALTFISITMFLYYTMGNGIVIIEFLPQLIPILISSIIGITGTFILSCILIPNCDTRPRFQKQNVLHPLYNI